MISTKGRYSIRILLDLAEHESGGYIPMKEVAARQEISLKYIERILPPLKAAGLIASTHGIGGGDMAPVSCLQADAAPCSRAAECRTLPVWEGYYRVTKEYFSGITLANLMNTPQVDNYVI